MSSSWPVWARSRLRAPRAHAQPDGHRGRRHSRHSRRGRRGQRGQSLVEFVLVLPVLLLMVLVAIDFGRALYGWVILQNSARIAANYAGLYPAGWQDSVASIQAEYETLLERDLSTANCDAPGTPPAPVFADGPDMFVPGGNPDTVYDVGDTVRVNLTCTFTPLTPIISSIVGQNVQLGASSEFRIRAGEITGLAFPTQIPPPMTPQPTGTPPPGPTPTPVPGCADPVANFSGTPTSGAGGSLTVTFTDASTTGVSCPIATWQWDFGDGQTSTQQNPVHLFTKTGNGQQQRFTVRLTVTIGGGQSDIETKNNYIEVRR